MSEDIYVVFFDRGYYEGFEYVFRGTLSELTLWMQEGHDGRNIDDLDVFVETNLDLLDLARQC